VVKPGNLLLVCSYCLAGGDGAADRCGLLDSVLECAVGEGKKVSLLGVCHPVEGASPNQVSVTLLVEAMLALGIESG
jgi:hypothetical protein